MNSQSVICVIKPEGYLHAGHILDMLQKMNLELEIASLTFSGAPLNGFLAAGYPHSFPPDSLCKYLNSDPMFIFSFRGLDVLSVCGPTAGPEDPVQARKLAPSSIRAMFGLSRIYNAIHIEYDETRCKEILNVIDDSNTGTTAIFTHCSLCLIKPQAVATHSGTIISRLMEAGLEISACRTIVASGDQINALMTVYRGVIPDLQKCCEELARGPMIALEVRGDEVVRKLRELAGPVDPQLARLVAPDTIRAVLGIDTSRNAIHCTDVTEDGIRECRIFFA
jgi:nucleoside-diphosphate kinase